MDITNLYAFMVLVIVYTNLSKGATMEPNGWQEECMKLRAENREFAEAYEKQRKHNGALEIAIQEAHRDTDAMKLQNEAMRNDFAEIELIARENFDGDQAPMGIIMSIADKHIVTPLEKRLCENKFIDKKCVKEYLHGGPCSDS